MFQITKLKEELNTLSGKCVLIYSMKGVPIRLQMILE